MAGYNLKEQGPTKDAKMKASKVKGSKKVSSSNKGASCKTGGFVS
jgi:hypothetical protein